MPKLAKNLSALEVKRLAEPGLHPVGTVPGLRLRISPSGSRSWVLRTVVGARRAEMGLGSYPAVTLAQAHERARSELDQIKAGMDPVAQRKAVKSASIWTFKATATAYIDAHRAGWKNAKHAAQWGATLETYAYPVLGEKPVAEVTRTDVLAVLTPIWTTKHETATRVRSRIELVLSYAMQTDKMPEALNPARWRGNLDKALSTGKEVGKVQHFAALPIDDMHGFMDRLRQMDGMGARALEFAILTASRTGAVRQATWAELDLAAAVWTSPAGHMKAGREHRVPLSTAAIELLRALPRFVPPPGQPDLIFPGMKGQPLSDMSLTACLRRMQIKVTAHGFRSTFSDWCSERTATPAEIREMALAHAIGDKAEAAYRRGDLFDKRRLLMEQWARFIDTAPAAGNVVSIRAA